MSYTVTDSYQAIYRVRGSKFFASIHYSATNLDAEKILQTIKNEQPTATHLCFAAIFLSPNKIEISSDDGEPSGTAGLPILNILKSSDLANTIITVVRYYGGTKLGKSGLIDAYSTAAANVVKTAALKQIIPIQKWLIQYDYRHQSIIDKLKNDYLIFEKEASYLEDVTLEIGIPNDSAEQVIQMLNSSKHLLTKLERIEDSFHIKK